MEETQNERKYQNYKEILDKPLPPTGRKIAVSLLTAKDNAETAKDSGSTRQSIQQSNQWRDTFPVSASLLVKKRQQLDAMIDKLDELLSRDSMEELKPRDVLAAMRLKAEITGILDKDKKDININVGVYDLRDATEEELLQELATIEERKRNAIDIAPNNEQLQQGSSTAPSKD